MLTGWATRRAFFSGLGTNILKSIPILLSLRLVDKGLQIVSQGELSHPELGCTPDRPTYLSLSDSS
jgi:hypothetical protein